MIPKALTSMRETSMECTYNLTTNGNAVANFVTDNIIRQFCSSSQFSCQPWRHPTHALSLAQAQRLLCAQHTSVSTRTGH
jgi:hypothetical protein